MAFNYSPRIVTNGLVLYLDAANPRSYVSGSTVWNDMSRIGNNGVLTNGPTYNSANAGSIVFDGTNDYVILPRPPQIVTSGSITISLWAKWTTTGTTISTIQILVDNNHSSVPMQGFFIQDRPDLSKKLTFGVTPNLSGVSSSFQVGDGTWRHITGTHTPGSSSLYINGVLDGVASDTYIASVQPNITLGYWQYAPTASSPGRYLNGNISQVQIYNRALSAQEVLQNYNALKGRFGL